ncbi:MAG: FtsW/RodA/SpoVE family cell cycle protein [Bacteroidales bacterium]|nr:FtsW/RodA/SpoVE family cell cycle protein [Bacteroidales bacterium]
MAGRKRTFWNFIDALEGDKVVWIIALLLILFSIVVIFSSTSQLLQPGETRLDLVKEQLVVIAVGLVLIIICYNIKDINFFKTVSALGFPISLILLLMLSLKIDTPLIHAQTINAATRTLQIAGVQIHVFEITKIAMVAYMSWVVTARKEHRLDFINNKWLRDSLFIYLPFALICLCIIWCGGTSSAIFLGGIMFLTVAIGSPSFTDAKILLLIGITALGLAFGVYLISGGKYFDRFDTVLSRLKGDSESKEEKFIASKDGSIEYYALLDEIRQMNSAKIAIHEGGLLGKGPGQSTQRYIVPIYSEDYVYSFIIEEYGLLGGIVVILLYVSLLARGSIIARNCSDYYGKVLVAGLTLLITGQAFMHMIINSDIGFLTGQTLPMISHGNSAFLCFALAFGLILSISRIANRKIEYEQKKEGPILNMRDDIQEDLNNLDEFESE